MRIIVPTGHVAGLDPVGPFDVLWRAAYALPGAYRGEAGWAMNARTIAYLRQSKDESGHYLWPPEGSAARSALLNWPVIEVEEIPDISPNSLSIAFGHGILGFGFISGWTKFAQNLYQSRLGTGDPKHHDAIVWIKFGAS